MECTHLFVLKFWWKVAKKALGVWGSRCAQRMHLAEHTLRRPNTQDHMLFPANVRQGSYVS